VEALNNIADDYDADEELADKMSRAMAYPILTVVIAAAVFFVVLVFVVPTFSRAYEAHSMSLPFVTSILVGLSHFITGYWWLWIPLLALGVYALRRRIVSNVHYFDGLVLRIPVIGPILIMGSLARFASTLKVLLTNGVPILRSLELARGAVNNTVIEDVIRRMEKNVEAGKSLVQPMAEAGFFPPIVVDMLFVGEESAKLPFVLEHVVKTLRLQLERTIGRLSLTLGPVMTLIVGGLVLLISLSLFIPYFDFLSALPDMR
ncbi:MAG: type II secretion system F family protein, partial [Myxococcales bacterium]